MGSGEGGEEGLLMEESIGGSSLFPGVGQAGLWAFGSAFLSEHCLAEHQTMCLPLPGYVTSYKLHNLSGLSFSSEKVKIKEQGKCI